MGTDRSGESRAARIAVGAVAGLVTAVAVLTMSGSRSEAKAFSIAGDADEVVNLEVQSLHESDQRAAAAAKPAIRERTVRAYARGGFQSGLDYLRVAQVLASSKKPDELLLAHDCAIASLALGRRDALPLIAVTEDKFLASKAMKPRYAAAGALTASHRSIMSVRGRPVPMRAVMTATLD